MKPKRKAPFFDWTKGSNLIKKYLKHKIYIIIKNKLLFLVSTNYGIIAITYTKLELHLLDWRYCVNIGFVYNALIFREGATRIHTNKSNIITWNKKNAIHNISRWRSLSSPAGTLSSQNTPQNPNKQTAALVSVFNHKCIIRLVASWEVLHLH